MKYLNFKRYKFSTVQKTFNTLVYSLFKIFKNISFKIFYLGKFFKYFSIDKLNITKYAKLRSYNIFNFNNLNIVKYAKLKSYNIFNFNYLNITKYKKFFQLSSYNIFNFNKKILFKSKFLFVHLPIFVILFTFLYVAIPTFYKYDKLKITKSICESNNLQCSIEGEVKYRFYPTPRLKIEDLKIEGFAKNKNNIINSDEAIIKLSFKNLLAKEKHKFKKIVLNKYKAKVNLGNFAIYKNILTKKINLNPIIFKKGQVLLYNKKEYVASIYDANIKGDFSETTNSLRITGRFLNDDILIKLKSKNFTTQATTDLVVKMKNSNFLSKINLLDLDKDKKKMRGNFLTKKEKNKITGIFELENNESNIKKSNLRNNFFEGKMEGKIVFSPFFDFDLEVNLSSLNFTKVYNHFLSLDNEKQKKLFKINNKLNGKINFSSDKIYSKNNLIKSFESRIKFYNGNLNLEQFLLNLGKLGAADMVGSINSDKKFTNLKFESNIFVDNKKKFLSKFGIYKVKNLFSNLFVSGNFDLENVKLSIYEISENEKLKANDINFIENEFNDIMLEDGFLNLFNFQKFKNFIKSITSEIN